jgi:TPP-dependent pyruvate/acetoin dehydrogenase alpha subunit
MLRLCGHGEHDDSHYVDSRLKSSPLGRDCLKLAEEQLYRSRWAEPDEVASWRHEAVQQVEDAVATVQREPAPNPFDEDWRALATRRLEELHSEAESDAG